MKKTIVLHSGLAPAAAADALRRSMDEEQITLFSFSGYKGDQPVLGVVTGNSFQLQKRRYWRNSFAPRFYGQIVPEPGGTRIEGHFDISEWVKVFMWWLGLVATFGIPIFVVTLIKFLNGTQTDNDPTALIVPPAMIVFGFVLPRFGRLLAKDEEVFLLQHLQKVLYAQLDPSP